MSDRLMVYSTFGSAEIGSVFGSGLGENGDLVGLAQVGSGAGPSPLNMPPNHFLNKTTIGLKNRDPV